MKKLPTISIAILMLLTLTACNTYATPNTPSDGNTPVTTPYQREPVATLGNSNNQDNETPDKSGDNGNGNDTSQPVTYIDGGFKHTTTVAGPSDQTQTEFGLYSVSIAFFGDTTGVNPEFSNFKLFVDGEQINTIYTLEVSFHAEGNQTIYKFEFPTTVDNNGKTHFILIKNNQEIIFDTTVFEIDYNGVTLRFGTNDLTELRDTFNIITGDVISNVG